MTPFHTLFLIGGMFGIVGGLLSLIGLIGISVLNGRI